MNKSLFKRATAIAAASALALSATLIAPLLTSAANCRDCGSADKAAPGYVNLACPNGSTHSTTGKGYGDTCGHVYGTCGGTLSEVLGCSNTACDDPTGIAGGNCTNTIDCPGTFVINCTNPSGCTAPAGDVNTTCTNATQFDCEGTVDLECSGNGCDKTFIDGDTVGNGSCDGEMDCDGTVEAVCSAGHENNNGTDVGFACGYETLCDVILDGSGECTTHGDDSGGSTGDPCGELIETCAITLAGDCTKCGNGTTTSAGGCPDGRIPCEGIITANCNGTCTATVTTKGACTNKTRCTGTIQGKCNATTTGCEGATTSTTTVTGTCTGDYECGGDLSGLSCNNPQSVDHSAAGTYPGSCSASLPNCAGTIAGDLCTNAWHDDTPPPPPPPADNDSGNGGGASSGGGSVVADMIAGGGIGGGGGGTNNTESGGGGKEVKVIADSAEAKLAVGNATRGTVTLSPDMGATSDVLEALTTVGANVKVWIPHGTHGVAIKGSDLGEGELKDLSFKGGAVAVPESIKSSFPEAKSITGMGFVESGDFGGVDQVMLSVRLDLDPKLWGSPITVYSVGEDGSLTKLEASRIVSGNGMVNVTITNYNSLIFVV